MSVYKGVNVAGQAVAVKVSGKIIESVEKIANEKGLPLLAVPLVDTQNNGALSRGYNAAQRHIDKIPEMVQFYRSHGVGKVMLTTTTCDVQMLIKSGEALSQLFADNQEMDTFFPGVFHEGIFMSKKDGWRGAHSLQHVKDPNYDIFKEINKAFNNRIKLVNVAPEEPGGMDFVERAANDGVRVSIGHACPTAEEVAEAVKRGATMVTHFGNGALPTIHRHKNPFWAFLAHDELTLGLIPDGHHIPKELIQTCINAKGRENVNFVSDCGSLTGMPAGHYGEEDGLGVTIEPNGFLHLTGQEILAGAWHQLDRGVELLCEMGWSLKEAWRQCSEEPARQFNIKLPKIEVGAPADFVLSTYSDNAGLTLNKVVINGEEQVVLPVNPVAQNEPLRMI